MDADPAAEVPDEPRPMQVLGETIVAVELPGGRGRLAATLTVFRQAGGLPQYDLTNVGDRPLHYGLTNEVEQLVDGAWQRPQWPHDVVVRLPAFHLPPGERCAPMPVLPVPSWEPAPGRWRLRTDVSDEVSSTAEELVLTAEFDWVTPADLPPTKHRVGIETETPSAPSRPVWAARRPGGGWRASSQLQEAQTAQTPPERLAFLARLPGEGPEVVRAAVARNPSAPLATLTQLARDPASMVRHGLADNPACPAELLTALCRGKGLSEHDQQADELVTVRLAALQHPNCPPDLRRELVTCGLVNGQVQAIDRQERKGGSYVRREVASDPETPFSLLESLARDPDPGVRSGAAANPSTSRALLELLADDPDPHVRAAVTANSSAPMSLREQVASRRDPMVEEELVHGGSCPPHVLRLLAADYQVAPWVGPGVIDPEGVARGWELTDAQLALAHQLLEAESNADGEWAGTCRQFVDRVIELSEQAGAD